MEQSVFEKTRSRTPVVDGLFYPEEPNVLKAQIRSWGIDEDSGCRGQGGIILAPHGAWELTGKIAGAAFAAVMGKKKSRAGADRVMLLGPVHRDSRCGLYLSDSAYFETPLGSIPVDRRLTGELESCGTLFEVNDAPHLAEHSLEVLLPLVKYCFPAAEIVPVLVGGSGSGLISVLAGALNLVLKNRMKRTLLVVSTNLSARPDPEKARTEADEIIRLLNDKDPQRFLAAFKEGRLSACGAPILAGLLESGLLEKKTLRIGPRCDGLGEEKDTVCYGALSFE
ncbi:MAG: AmmeMemoRadiSam system protein B [Treponema sp.]|jgi:AmmeMemoRadiSam system protein B|nr:AmmeMemoRadiSam system protein B [Treponema sp.]